MLCGIFVGGQSRRMNGFPKALLRDAATGETLLARAIAVAREASLEPVLVGAGAADGAWTRLRDEEPASRALATIEDAAPGCGPLAGVVALLRAAGGPAIVLACDMPRVDAASLRLLATLEPGAPILAAKRDGRWEPLLARYGADALAIAEARLARGELSLQGLLGAAGALVTTALGPMIFDDVDTPEGAQDAGLVRAPRAPLSSRPVSLP